jgi:hypothetical protein
MTTRYINLDASQAISINESNNRYKVQLNETLELPTGTEVSVQNSLINLQGITGQSIELEKDFDETILFNYYLLDTSYPAPIQSVSDPTTHTSYNVYDERRIGFNGEFGFLSQPNGLIQRNETAFLNGVMGFTENVMPLVGVKQITQDGVSKNFLIPFCGKANIFIKKGIYSVESLAERITDQINRVTSGGSGPDVPNPNQSNYDFKRTGGYYNGLSVNYTTNRNIQTPSKSQVIAFQQDPGALWANDLPDIRALDIDDTGQYGVYAIKPSHFNDILYQAQNNAYSVQETPNTAIEEYCFSTPAGQPTVNPRFGITLTQANGTDYQGEGQPTNFRNYNLFNNGTMIGTTGFEMTYDSKASGFSFSHLHEPRRIPTNDRYGNSLSNPSQECVFTKRIYNPLQITGGTNPAYDYYEGATTEEKETIYSTLNAIMGRTSGIQIYNWAYKTALNNATKNNENIYISGRADQRDFFNYNDFFQTPEQAKSVWEQTLWYRLGFTYEQLASTDQYEQNYWYGDTEIIHGTTTQPDVDQTVIPFVSTLYNDLGLAAEKTPEGDQATVLPAVGVVQLFDLNDQNVPLNEFNNNKKAKALDTITALPVCVSPYMGSFYTFATCIPVQTDGLDIVADSLPRLSVNGYMLVLSDLVNQNDQAGDRSEVGILDLIPKSSLSNQDFISTINQIVHTLSNPKVVNSIDINIVNGDLTDLELEPNSTILLKITTPTPRPTELLANAQERLAENEVQQEVTQMAQQQQKASQKK